MPPTFVAAGAVATGTTTATPAFPAGIASSDILIDIAESVGGQNITLPSGWAHVGSPAVSPAVQGVNTQLTVIWRRYDGTGTAPALAGTVDHVIGRMIAIRGCPSTGNPWNVVAASTSATSSTASTMPGVTTTIADTLVLEIIATGADVNPAGTAQITTMTNAAYTSFTEIMDNNTPTGNGGVIGCWSGIKATVGATGGSSVTLATAATKAMITLAMAPAQMAPQRPLRLSQSVQRSSIW